MANMTCLITGRERRYGKVIFSQVSVCHSVQGDPHVAVTHDALRHGYPPTLNTKHGTYLAPPHTRHGTYLSPLPYQAWDLPPATDILWSSLETCSNCPLKDLPIPSPPIDHEPPKI